MSEKVAKRQHSDSEEDEDLEGFIVKDTL
jgi:hypothetical protein